MTNNKLISTSQLPAGVLNTPMRERAHETFTLGGAESFMDVVNKLMRQSFGPGFTFVNREFTAICIQVLSNKETQRLMAASSPQLHYQRVAKTTDTQIPQACRVYIPEIHADRALPKSILNPSEKDLSIIKAMFPVFVAQTEELSKKPLYVGDRITIKIKNELGGGVYVNREKSSFSINPFSAGANTKPSSDLFRCEILKTAKVITTNSTSIAGNTTITNETQGKNQISDAAMTQQYIKYLYETEIKFIKQLKSYWTKAKLAAALKAAIEKHGPELTADLTPLLPILWALTYQVSGYVPAGLAVGGNTIISAKAVEDYYGMYRVTRKAFDTTKLELAKFPFFSNAGLQHVHLLDPRTAMEYFVIDFHNYLDATAQQDILDFASADTEKDPLNLTDKNKSIVAKYFTKNEKRVEILFPSSFDKMLKDWKQSATNAAGETLDDAPKPFTDSFEDWLTMSMSGVPSTTKMTEPIPEPEANPQGPTVDSPPSTPDECHSNYPSYSDYAIHVNAQKKMVRKFFNSKVSGLDLELINSEHKGIRSIKFAELEIPCPFKIVRFDGHSGYPKDGRRWFDKNNFGSNLLINKERLAFSYYRSREQITHLTAYSLGDNLDDKFFYKNTIHTMIDLGKSIPHFIITPNGQIVQLIDMACIINSRSPVNLFSVNVALATGTGGKTSFVNADPAVTKQNCVLIKDENTYSCHKLGTKAALQSMHKLIKFFMTITKIKYKLAAFDNKIKSNDYNKSTIQSLGQLTSGVSGMNFIYYAWTYNLARTSGGKNILNEEIFS